MWREIKLSMVTTLLSLGGSSDEAGTNTTILGRNELATNYLDNSLLPGGNGLFLPHIL